MKRMMKHLTLVAVAAMGLTACQNGFEEITNQNVKSVAHVQRYAHITQFITINVLAKRHVK